MQYCVQHKAKHNAHASCQRLRCCTAKRHEAPAGRFASTSQLPSTSKRGCRAGATLWCGKRLQLQLQLQLQALNGGKQSGGNFHSTYAPWPATAPQQPGRTDDQSNAVEQQRQQQRRLWCRRGRAWLTCWAPRSGSGKNINPSAVQPQLA